MKGFPCRIRGEARTQDLNPELTPEPARCRAAVLTAPGKVPHANKAEPALNDKKSPKINNWIHNSPITEFKLTYRTNWLIWVHGPTATPGQSGRNLPVPHGTAAECHVSRPSGSRVLGPRRYLMSRTIDISAPAHPGNVPLDACEGIATNYSDTQPAARSCTR
jgi:hypothetical protein